MISFKEIPDEDKPRERLIREGAMSLSNEELLMILLKTGTKNYSVKEIAISVLSSCGKISELRNFSFNQLLKIDGIGRVKATEIIAMIELGRRVNRNVQEEDILSFSDPLIIVQYFNEIYRNVNQEEFYCVYLNQKKKYIAKKRLFVGTVNYSVVHPREIFKEAYLLSASFFICVHNHPSGDPTPSKEDVVMTEKLKKLGKIHAIYLVDHLIIGKDIYYSFYENGSI